MAQITWRSCGLALFFVLAAAPAFADDTLPPETRGFARTKMTRLLAVWGEFPRPSSPLVIRINDPDAIGAIAIAPDGKRALLGRGDRVEMWDVGKGERLAAFAMGKKAATGIAFSPDGQSFAAGCDGRGSSCVRVCDATTGAERWSEGAEGANPKVAFSPDGKTVWIASYGAWGALESRNAASGKEGPRVEIQRGRNEIWSYAIALSPDGARALAGGVGGAALCDLSGATVTGRLWAPNPDAQVTCVAFSPPDGKLAALTASHGVEIWDLGERTCVRTLSSASGEFDSGSGAHDIIFSRDGRYVIGAIMGRVWIWETATGRVADVIDLKSAGDLGAYRLAMTPDGGSLLVGTFEKVVLRFAFDADGQ
jgi:WD40 repeat protein